MKQIKNGNEFLESDLYLKSGVSYDYLPNWSEALQLGWWQPGPHYGPGKWDALTPISQCAWHWATQFNQQQTGGNLLPNLLGRPVIHEFVTLFPHHAALMSAVVGVTTTRDAELFVPRENPKSQC